MCNGRPISKVKPDSIITFDGFVRRRWSYDGIPEGHVWRVLGHTPANQVTSLRDMDNPSIEIDIPNHVTNYKIQSES